MIAGRLTNRPGHDRGEPDDRGLRRFPIRLRPPTTDSAARHALAGRLDDAERSSTLSLWRAAQTAGAPVAVVGDGDIAISATSIQRAIVEARIAHARRLGCDLVGASANQGGSSARNMERTGLQTVAVRRRYRVPANA